MTFASWCACHAFDSRRRLNALEQGLLRVRLAKETQRYQRLRFLTLWKRVMGELA